MSSSSLSALPLVVALIACQPENPLQIQPGTVFVAIRDTSFTPDTIHVDVGFRVRWTNEGALSHTVASDSSFWASSALTPGAVYEVRFDSAGTFTYHCSVHPVMVGTVIADP